MLKEKVKQTIKKFGMLSPGNRVVVGVSGGPDSVALLHILKELAPRLKISLSLAHLNHRFRSRDSDRDAEYVQELALELGLPVIVESRDVPAFIKKEGLSPEDGARRARYDFFARAARQIKADTIALGHNADDQAETVLIRLLRGSGREGLGGIPPVRELKPGSRVKIIRPLIEATREEIERYLKENRIKSRLDASNIEPVYLRNRIKLKLLPFLTKYNPNVKSILVRTAQILGEEDRYLEGIVNKHIKRIMKKKREGVTLDIVKLSSLSLPIQRRFLRKSLGLMKGNKLDIHLAHIDDILDLLKARGRASLDLPENILVTKEYKKLSLGFKKEKRAPSFDHPLKVPGITKIPEIGLFFQTKVLKEGSRALKKALEKRAYFDYQRIKAPLFLRNREEGDRFQPLGMRGRKKLKDFFIDEKIPLKERERTPLLLSGKEIIWVVGHRISEKAKITNKTEEVLMVEVKRSIQNRNPKHEIRNPRQRRGSPKWAAKQYQMF